MYPLSGASAAPPVRRTIRRPRLGPSGIRVNCVAPGVVDTRMNGQLEEETLAQLREETPLGRVGTPEEAAAAIAFLASDEASFLTGQVVCPNGGLVV